MKAIVLREYGGPETLLYEDVDVPRIGDHEALFRVRAAGVLTMDVETREGRGNYGERLPMIPGRSAVGEVVEVGERVANLRPKDRVFVYGDIPCGTCSYCRKGQENICTLDPTKKGLGPIFGCNTDGGYAEYAKWPAECLIPVPQNVPLEEATALRDLGNAWHALIEMGRLQAGEDILILAGGSSSATAAIQIARFAGARVFVTTSTDKKAEHARQLGADFVINYLKTDFSQEVLRLTGGRGMDVVMEVTGEATFTRSIASLSPHGRLIVFGFNTGPEGAFNLMSFARREQTMIGSAFSTRSTTAKMAQMMGEGKFRGVAPQTYALEDAGLAQMACQRGEHIGKALLIP